MNSGKILLINVSKGKIGEDNSALLGAMFITKIQMAAMERVRIPEDKRVDFYLYVDEFQNFATESFAGILSEARKYRLNLILAHQYVGQLVTDVSQKVRDAIFGNVGTMIVFRVGARDAEFLEKEFAPEFSAEDMVNLPNYNVYLKMMIDGVSCRPFSAITLPPFKIKSNVLAKEKIIEVSRKKYALPKYAVEEQIKEFTSSGIVNLEIDLSKQEENIPKEKVNLKAKNNENYIEALAKLGIEFELKSPKQDKKFFKDKQKFQKQDIKNKEDKNLKTVDLNKTISLKDLKPIKQFHNPKVPNSQNVNIEDFKESIKKSLENLDQ
jgi:hypothetical protein